MTNPAKLMPRADIVQFFSILQAANPEPKTELEYASAFELLAAVLLSAQATDISVNKATRPLFARANTPQAIIDLGPPALEDALKTIGLYRSKAKNLLATCHILMAQHGGEIPHSREALESLPGVGRKTANVWLNCALGQPTIGVDTHVFRVANRLGLCATTTPQATEQALEKTIPARWKQHAHHWLILHGRYVCKARKPECGRCRVQQWCLFPKKT